jgi:hypothetical protein
MGLGSSGTEAARPPGSSKDQRHDWKDFRKQAERRWSQHRHVPVLHALDDAEAVELAASS